MIAISWQCPYCNQHTTIPKEFKNEQRHYINKHARSGLHLKSEIFICHNPKCNEYTITCSLCKSNDFSDEVLIKKQIKPDFTSKSYPKYVPKKLLKDYKEACAIKELSPNASATMSRRCLQGMITNKWKIKGRLATQIKNLEQIKTINSNTWEAIDSVRKIGNIGAHMEKDENLIIDVEPDEAEALIFLIETLIEEWYVEEHKRQEKLKNIKAIADKKEAMKKN